MFVTSYKLDVEDAELPDKFKLERESPFQGCMVDLSRFEDWNADLALTEDQRSEKHLGVLGRCSNKVVIYVHTRSQSFLDSSL